MYTAEAQARADAARRRNAIEDEWFDEQKPALVRLKCRALDLAETADMILCQRQLGYRKDHNDKLRDYVAGHLEATADLLSDLLGMFRREADEAGLDPDMLAFDDSDIREEVERWA